MGDTTIESPAASTGRTAPGYLPGTIRQMVIDLWEATGAVPVVEPLNARTWRITVANDRVVMVLEMRRNASRHIRPHRTTLTVDGTERDPVCGMAAFADVFLDPPDGPPPVAPGEPIPLPPDRPADQAPHKIAEQFRQMQKAMARAPALDRNGNPRSPATVSLGYARGRWVVGLRGVGARGEFFIRWCWVCDDHGQWMMTIDGSQVIVGGRDITEDTGGDMARAIKIALGHMPMPSGGPASPAAPTRAAARSNAVEARRASVWRI